MRAEVLNGPERRRRWSDDERALILAELAKPGVRGVDVARRFGVCSGLLYTWRKKQRAVVAGSDHMQFAPVLLAERKAAPPSEPAVPDTLMIEIEVQGARVRLPPCVSAAMVAATIRALRGQS